MTEKKHDVRFQTMNACSISFLSLANADIQVWASYQWVRLIMILRIMQIERGDRCLGGSHALSKICIILHITLSMIVYRLEWVHFQHSILTPTWNFIKHFAISSKDDIDEFPYGLFFQNLIEDQITIIIIIIIIIPLFTIDLGRLLVRLSKQLKQLIQINITYS